MRPGDEPTRRIDPPGPESTRRFDPAENPTQRIDPPDRTGGGGTGGEVLAGRYRLEGLLGSGGMADVYRATDLRLDRPVAVKVFRPGTDPEGERRFREEARTLANLRHPGLVAVHDVEVDSHRLFLVMELIDGPTLHDEIARGPFEAGEVTRIGRELAQVLAAVHEQGVVHRDIKPSNVLLEQDGRVRLTDFGIARLVGNAGLTSADVAMGTAAYLSPEQVRGDRVGPPADMYALGLVLVEALTGRPEYEGTGWPTAEERLRRPPVVPRDTPQPLREALHAMTVTDPERRATAREVAGMLSRAPRPAAPAEPVSLGGGRRAALTALGVALLLVLVLGVAFAAGGLGSGSGSSTAAEPAAPTTAAPAPTRAPRTTEEAAPATADPGAGPGNEDGNSLPSLPTALPDLPDLPTALPDLPDLPDIPTALPSLPQVPDGVQDDARDIWTRISDWWSSLF